MHHCLYATVHNNMPLDFKTEQCVRDSLIPRNSSKPCLSMNFKYERSKPHLDTLDRALQEPFERPDKALAGTAHIEYCC